jgi:hypothetical protein
MSEPSDKQDEIERAVWRLAFVPGRMEKGAAYFTSVVRTEDVRLLLSDRSELSGTVECLLEACRLAVGPLGSTGPTPVYQAVLAAIAKATTPQSTA